MNRHLWQINRLTLSGVFLISLLLLALPGCTPDRPSLSSEGGVISENETSPKTPAQKPVLLISVRTEDRILLEQLLELHPFPGNYSPLFVPPGEEKIVLCEGSPEGRLTLKDSIVQNGDNRTTGGQLSAILQRRPLVPVVPLGDPRMEVNLQEALELKLALPEEVTLPERALPISGLVIDDTDYPLWETKVLSLNGETSYKGTPFFEEMEEWFSGIANLSELKENPHFFPSTEVRWIAGVGDIMVQRGIQDILIARGEEGIEYIFGDTLPILRAQDFLMGNLEGAVSYRGTPIPKSYNFRFSPEVLPWLRAAGFNYLSITNNHCYDYGTVGFADTLLHLENAGIATSGAGLTPSEAYRPFETVVSGFPLKVLSVGAYPREKNGFNGRTMAAVSETRGGIIFSGPEVLDTIRGFAGPHSIDIVVAHGGREWSSEPVPEQRDFYRECIDAGADLIVGHHPHVLQGMEAYHGGLIAYSVGNFLFPGMGGMAHAEETVILSIGFVGARPLYVQPRGVHIDNRRIRLETPTGPVLRRFLDMSG